METETEISAKPSLPMKRCGECGRPTQRFHSVYKGFGFCCACYARVFIRRKCLACGNGYRIHPKQSFDYCRACRPKMMPCFRCSKTNYPIGLYYNDKPVCNSCAPHFKPEQQCPQCGQFSTALSKAFDFDVTTPICKQCISSYHQPCELCNKPRHPLKEKGGKRLCNKCYNFGNVTCPDCGEAYAAGYGVRCKDCSCRRLTKNKAEIARHLYEHESTQREFLKFSEWLLKHTTPLKATVSVNSFHPFFKMVDEQPNDWNLNPHALAALDKGLLRKNGYARLFYESIGKAIPKSVIETVPTHRAIRSHLDFIYKATSYPLSSEAQEYAAQCHIKCELGKTKIRTLKQQLSAVVSLVKYLERCNKQLTQSSISEFLRHYPGLEASVTGFLIFIDGPRPKVRLSGKHWRRSSRAILTEYLRQWRHKPPSVKVIRAALEYLHGVPREVLSEVTMAHVYQVTSAKFHVRIHGLEYVMDFKRDPQT